MERMRARREAREMKNLRRFGDLRLAIIRRLAWRDGMSFVESRIS